MKFVTPLLLLCASTTTLGVAKDDDSSKGKGDGPPFFLIDSSDQLCLAGEEFKRCSINTLFSVVGSPGKFVIIRKLLGVDGELSPLAGKKHQRPSNCKLHSSRYWNKNIVRKLSNSETPNG